MPRVTLGRVEKSLVWAMACLGLLSSCSQSVFPMRDPGAVEQTKVLPRVLPTPGVEIRGTAWSAAVPSQPLDSQTTIPWNNVDRISAVLDPNNATPAALASMRAEDLVLAHSSLAGAVANVGVRLVTILPDDYRIEITLAAPLASGRYALALCFGGAAPNQQVVFAVVQGDGNADGFANIGDVLMTRSLLGQGEYDLRHDIDGSGTMDSSDWEDARSEVGSTSLTLIEQPVPSCP